MSKAAWKRVAFLRLGACVAPVALLELSLFHAPPTQHPRAAIFRRRQIACLVRRVRPAFIPVLAMAGLRGGRMETI
jgi:hypothetical protein